MNLIRFCENHYQELNYSQQCRLDYDVKVDAEIKCVHLILTTYRTVLKWILVPKCLFQFVLVNLGLLREPVPVLINKIKQQKEAEEVAKQMLADGKITALKLEPKPVAAEVNEPA